jgi:hypothetical protein
MQTFVPERTFADIALVLDYKRLGKQRVEVLQILRANLGLTKGWVNHPASKMWAGHEAGLCAYGLAMCDAWTAKGYKDTCAYKMQELIRPDANDLPDWWGRTDIIESHRSNLVAKFPEHYRNFYPNVVSDLPYVWVV